MNNKPKIENSRRKFIAKSLSSCALCLFAGPNILDMKTEAIGLNEQQKFQSDSGMTIQQVYGFAFKQWYIPAMKNLMDQIGKEKFLEMLKKSSEMIYQSTTEKEINYEERTLPAWSAGIKKGCQSMSNRLTYEIVKDDDKVFKIKFTECLWAKTFRESNASEIGYMGCCYQDYPNTKKYNPKLSLLREKTLMQGQDCCHFIWKMEA